MKELTTNVAQEYQKGMTIKEIADLCNTEERTVQRWIQVLSPSDYVQRIEVAIETNQSITFTLEETIGIIKTGGNETLANMLLLNVQLTKKIHQLECKNQSLITENQKKAKQLDYKQDQNFNYLKGKALYLIKRYRKMKMFRFTAQLQQGERVSLSMGMRDEVLKSLENEGILYQTVQVVGDTETPYVIYIEEYMRDQWEIDEQLRKNVVKD